MPGDAVRMRDAFLDALAVRMQDDPRIFMLSADFGSPRLDRLIRLFPDRFLNVGIAEQNLINVATGLALEGHCVIAYAIAPFITMRCYEQTRVNLAMLSALRPLHVTLVGVGAGFSYDLSGPTHQALEDVSIMRTLPNVEIGMPCDDVGASAFAAYVTGNPGIRYVRLDGKAVPRLGGSGGDLDFSKGFREVRPGADVCLVATGYMVHKALEASRLLAERGIASAVADVFLLNAVTGRALARYLEDYPAVVTLEEGLAGKGGLDSWVLHRVHPLPRHPRFLGLGLRDEYRFDVADRDALLEVHGLSADRIAARVGALVASPSG